MNSCAECSTCVINFTFRDASCKLCEKTGVVVGPIDSHVREIIGISGTKLLACDSIQDGLVDSSVANIVVFNVEASIASGDTCHIHGRGRLVCLEGGRVHAEAVVEVHLEHVLELCHGHLSKASIDCSCQFRALLSADRRTEGCDLSGPIWSIQRLDAGRFEGGQAKVV